MTAPIFLAFGVLILVVGTIHVVLVRPRINQWGASDQEHLSTWPGDELVALPSFVWTNAITIKAPAAKIWPWLVQLGQGRGGLYSYDWLENLIGCDVHSADRILPAFQTPLQLGDRVIRMARYAPCAPVAVFEPQRALVLGHIKDTYADLTAGHARSSWAFIFQPVDQDTTRLLIRCRGNSLMARLQGPCPVGDAAQDDAWHQATRRTELVVTARDRPWPTAASPAPRAARPGHTRIQPAD
jgi:hypothetical protein